MTILADFKARFPEFGQSEVNTHLPRLIDVYPCYYGGVYETCGKEIVLNLLAHLFVVYTKQGTEGPKPTQSKSVGNVSVSYGSELQPESNRMAWFMSTKYGRQYMMLTRSRQGGFFV